MQTKNDWSNFIFMRFTYFGGIAEITDDKFDGQN